MPLMIGGKILFYNSGNGTGLVIGEDKKNTLLMLNNGMTLMLCLQLDFPFSTKLKTIRLSL